MKTLDSESWPHGIERHDWLFVRRALRDGTLTLVDLRSPAEFAQGHIPYAVNVPLLNNEERHQVGLTYKTIGQLEATSLGIELFAKKAETFLAQIEAQLKDRKIALHCWRGGMRSQMVGTWLASMGLHATVLEGGYKSFRRQVLNTIERFAAHELLVLDGRTGSGKSDLLRQLTGHLPLVDLEGIARHRGSAFGGFAQCALPPSQQDFENTLADQYLDLESAPVILVEIENFIGPIEVPKPLRDKIFASKVVLLERDFDDRVERLAKEYSQGWTLECDTLFETQMELLRRYTSGEERISIIEAVHRRDFRTAVALLLRLRYDKTYDRGIAKRQSRIVATFNLTHEKDAAIAYLSDYIAH